RIEKAHHRNETYLLKKLNDTIIDKKITSNRLRRYYQREEFESSKVENNVDVFDSQNEKSISRSRTHQQRKTLNDFSKEKEIENEAHSTETSRRMKNEEIEEIFENDAE